MPGLGFLRWQVELLRVRNGHPGTWVMEWADNKFVPIEKEMVKEERLTMAG